MPETALCSKCGENPRADDDGTNPWCKPCRAKYQKEYQEGKLGRERSKGFAAGVEAMRNLLVDEFDKIGSGYFTGTETAVLIERAPGPPIPQG